ncbi:hypothetical protein [Brevibacterium picturae]|uniref:Uncharacterized protein n=1 Tax=Brevibacterium picturae TaxID=260553 RepID=A0ABN2BR94_9MICO
MSGPTRNAPTRSSRQSHDPGRNRDKATTAEANLDALRQSIRSYAMVDDTRDPKTNIHVSGLPGVNSLNSATEKTLLRTIRSAGGFHGHRAYSPVATSPVHHWESTAFVPATATSAKDADDGHRQQAVRGDRIREGRVLLLPRLR